MSEMKDQLILGKGQYASMDCAKTRLNNNVLCVGTSGSGKTYSYVESLLCHIQDHSLIVTVTKERIVRQYWKSLQERGYRVDYLDLVEPNKGTIGFDPLKLCTNEKDVHFLAEALIRSGKGSFSSDPYWDDMSVLLLTSLLGYIQTQPKASMYEVCKLFHLIDFDDTYGAFSTVDYLYQELEKKQPDHFALKGWKNFSRLSEKTSGCVYSCLSSVLDNTMDEDLQKMFQRKNQLDFSRFTKRKSVLFVRTSPVNPVYQSFVNVLYGMAFKSLFEIAQKRPEQKLKTPVHLIADDFATGGIIPNFAKHLSIFREAGISVSLLLQSESQLSGLYGANDATTIINNCDTYLYMGGLDLATCRSISEKTNRPLEDILYMKPGEQFIIRRGQKPVFCDQYPILEDPIHQKISNDMDYLIGRLKNGNKKINQA